MTIEEKLKHFEEASMEQARIQSMEIVSKHQEALAQIEKEHKETKIRQANLQVKAETEQLKQQMNMTLSKEQLQMKRRITKHHNELTEKLFHEVKINLEEYMKTQEYEQLLLKQIRKVLSIAGEEQVVIYMDADDVLKLDSLQEISGVPIKVSSDSFIGGIRAVLPNRHILIDDSFASKLAEEKEAFTFDGGISHE